ncbi:MAG TPA: hypothetical protein VFG69_06065 [Nannocystaceae bacterium]|nr:hypothetical protein [Nannocystaceae bacterium]
MLALVLATSGCWCGEEAAQDDAAPDELAPTPDSGDAPIAAEPPATPLRVVVHEASALAGLDLTQTRELDLALSEIDRLGRMDELDPAAACTGLDLRELAGRAPALRRLRVSGCAVALADAGALAPTLEELTLADVAIDAAMIGQLPTFTALHTLVLTRVTAPDEIAVAPLAMLALRRVALHELDRDSPLADMLALWPKTLKEVSLVGSWAGHDAMQTLSKAAALEVLELRDTRVGNFSLNQIKPLSHLRELHWAGDTFNDNSPLYFRELDVQTLVCDCPRFGDGGLQTLRHCESVRHLELAHSRVSDAGLAALVRLPKLESLVLHERDVGEAGFVALAAVPTLKRLELSGDTASPALPHLGDLRGLEVLVLGYPSVDDRAAPELAKLTALQRLVLAGTKVSDVGLVAIAGMTALRELSLSRTRITNRGLAHLARATKLEQLELDHTDLVDAALVHLAGLSALTRLRIDHTLVTDAGLAHLHRLRALRSLDVSGTVVTAAGLAELRAALPELVVLTNEPR